jgi:hypothetical protein
VIAIELGAMEWGNENQNPENRAVGQSVFIASILVARFSACACRPIGALSPSETDDHIERLTTAFDRGGICGADRITAAKPII